MVLLVKSAGHLLYEASGRAMLLLLFTVLHTVTMHEGKNQTGKIPYQCKQNSPRQSYCLMQQGMFIEYYT